MKPAPSSRTREPYCSCYSIYPASGTSEGGPGRDSAAACLLFLAAACQLLAGWKVRSGGVTHS